MGAILDGIKAERGSAVQTGMGGPSIMCARPNEVQEEREGERKQQSVRAPASTTTQPHQHQEGEEKDKCPICLDELNPPNRIVSIFHTECEHPFHSMCLLQWIRRIT